MLRSKAMLEKLNNNISYRQLDHWCGKGWVNYDGGVGSGTERIFEYREYMVLELAVVYIKLLGMAPQRAIEIARVVRATGQWEILVGHTDDKRPVYVRIGD